MNPNKLPPSSRRTILVRQTGQQDHNVPRPARHRFAGNLHLSFAGQRIHQQPTYRIGRPMNGIPCGFRIMPCN